MTNGFDLDQDLNLWILKVKCDLELWPHTWPWPLIFAVKFWNSCISEWEGWLTLHNGVAVGHSWTFGDNLVTKVRCMDLPDSDWGDFSCRRAVDSCSFRAKFSEWWLRYLLWITWIPLDLTDDKSTLVQVMAWCRQATSHYLTQFWLRTVSPYGIPWPQWVKVVLNMIIMQGSRHIFFLIHCGLMTAYNGDTDMDLHGLR